MENPISAKARGRLYVLGIIIGAMATVFGPLSAALGLSDEWSSVVTSVVGALILITGTLSKANLTMDTTNTDTSADTEDGDTAASTTETTATDTVTTEDEDDATDITSILASVDAEIQAEEAPVGDVDTTEATTA